MIQAMTRADTPMPGEDPGALIEDLPNDLDPATEPDTQGHPPSQPKPVIPEEDDPAIEETEGQPT